MAETVRAAVRELLEQTVATMDALLAVSGREQRLPSSHACAQGKDVWTLVTNDIDHEKIHTGQVLEQFTRIWRAGVAPAHQID